MLPLSVSWLLCQCCIIIILYLQWKFKLSLSLSHSLTGDSVSSDEEFTFSDEDEGSIGVASEHYETLVSKRKLILYDETGFGPVGAIIY